MKRHNKYINYETKGIINRDFLIKEYIFKHRSATNIAKEIKCAHQTIIYYLRKYNIRVRPKDIACKGIKRGKMTKQHKINLSNSKTHNFLNYHIKMIKYYNNKWRKISDIEWAWIAGFYEGEGCLQIRTRMFCRKPEGFLSITQKEKHNLVYIRDLLGCGGVYKQLNPSGFCHKFRLTKGDAVKVFLYKILPNIKSPKRLKQISKLIPIIFKKNNV